MKRKKGDRNLDLDLWKSIIKSSQKLKNCLIFKKVGAYLKKRYLYQYHGATFWWSRFIFTLDLDQAQDQYVIFSITLFKIEVTFLIEYVFIKIATHFFISFAESLFQSKSSPPTLYQNRAFLKILAAIFNIEVDFFKINHNFLTIEIKDFRARTLNFLLDRSLFQEIKDFSPSSFLVLIKPAYKNLTTPLTKNQSRPHPLPLPSLKLSNPSITKIIYKKVTE